MENPKNKQVDVLIIGAGPAGVVASTYLTNQGFNVLVVEKAKFPRFVIGESLLPRCMDNFEEVGLLPFLEKQNYQRKKGVIFKKGNEDSMFDFSEQFTDGKKETWQVPRAHFDNVLAEGAKELGVNIWFEVGATSVQLLVGKQITTIEDNEGNTFEISSKYIIDSSGYGRVLPKLLDLDESSSLPVRTTMFTHFEDKKREQYKEESEYIMYLVNPHHYVWNIPFANNTTSIGVVGENEIFDAKEGDVKEKLTLLLEEEPYFTERYNSQDMVFEPRTLKGFSVGVKKLYGNGYVLTGNSTEFLDPIFSSGVTLATESALIGAKLVEKELNGKKVEWEEEYEKKVRFGIEVFKTYVNAWYDQSLHRIFFTKHHSQDFRKQICSILAGYVWDMENPCVKRYKTILHTLDKILEIQHDGE